MPDVKALIDLLRLVARAGQSDDGRQEIEELLMKISQTSNKVQIEVNYDGREFKWKLTQSNVTASSWTPSHDSCDRH
jgi:hypothetical protein